MEQILLKTTLKSILIVLALINTSGAIDEISAEESPCFNISNAVDPDDKWLSSVEKWYYPLASRLDFYRSVHDLLQTDYQNIPEYSLYYDSCLEWTINSDGYTLMGYNGRKRHLKTTPVRQGTADFQSEWSEGMKGRAYTTLTDNKTFIFTAACFADNQISWNLFATTKTLDDKTKQQIFEHAKSLGYKEDYFTEIRYDSCGQKTGFVDESLSNVHLMSNTKPFSCKTCQKMCPNLTVKKEYFEKYYKAKIDKYFKALSEQQNVENNL